MNQNKEYYNKEMITQENIKFSELLKRRDFKPPIYDEDYNLLEDSLIYDFLKEYLYEILEEKIEKEQEIKELEIKNIFYSLSYSQGDGVCFEGTFKYKGIFTKVSHSGRYYHHDNKNIDLFDYDEKLTEEEIEKYIDEINEIYITICRDLEYKGYNYIEEEEKRQLDKENLRQVFENLDIMDYDLYNVELKTKEHLIKYNEDFNTYVEIIEGYYLKDFDIKINKYLETSIKYIEDVFTNGIHTFF